MGLFSADIKTMNDLYVHQLQDIYYAEKQIIKSLPGHDRQVDRQRSESRPAEASAGNRNPGRPASSRCSSCWA